MTSISEKFYSNSIIHADFSSDSIDNDFAIEIAKALRANNSIVSIDFSCSNLKDNPFLIIVQALKDRALIITELNLGLTDLTKESIKPLIDLMNLKLIKSLLMYNMKTMFADPSNKTLLEDAAQSNKINLDFDKLDESKSFDFSDMSQEEKENDSEKETKDFVDDEKNPEPSNNKTNQFRPR